MTYVNAVDLPGKLDAVETLEKVRAPWFDHFVSTGAAMQAVYAVMDDMRLNKEVRLRCGLITVYKDGEEVGRAGVYGIQPTADDWFNALRFLT